METWKDINDYEGLYRVSSEGNVFSIRSNKVLKQGKTSKASNGSYYFKVDLCKNGKQESALIHRLVAQAFILNPENKPQVNHIDGNKLNNSVENLEWCTREENQQHAWENGLHEKTREVFEQNRSKNIAKINEKRKRKVEQYSLNGEYIATFDSMRDAGRSLGNASKQGTIYECCAGNRKKAYGYKWKFVD